MPGDTPSLVGDVSNSFSSRRGRWSCTSFIRGLSFAAKNMIAWGSGILVGVGLRAVLGTSSTDDPTVIEAKNGTTLVVTDIVSSVTTLLLCHFWLKPTRARWKDSCCQLEGALRTVLRDGIPLLVGLGSMFIVKYLDVEINGPDHALLHGPNHSTLFEYSDLAGGFLLLVSFHGLDRLLESRWPMNLYDDIDREDAVEFLSSQLTEDPESLSRR